MWKEQISFGEEMKFATQFAIWLKSVTGWFSITGTVVKNEGVVHHLLRWLYCCLADTLQYPRDIDQAEEIEWKDDDNEGIYIQLKESRGRSRLWVVKCITNYSGMTIDLIFNRPSDLNCCVWSVITRKSVVTPFFLFNIPLSLVIITGLLCCPRESLLPSVLPSWPRHAVGL